MVQIKNKLKEKIIVLIWVTLKAEHTMKDLAESTEIPLATFHRYVKEHYEKKNEK